MRTAGILMPITSLPSPYGIGTLGQDARDFICFLEKAGQTYWQILPIGPLGYGDSPYSSCSTFAGSPYMIDLDDLVSEGLLEESQFKDLAWGENPTKVDYEIQYNQRFTVLASTVPTVLEKFSEEYQNFCKEEGYWLDDYALFMAIKRKYEGAPWSKWPQEIRVKDTKVLDILRESLKEEIIFWKTVQFLFFRQWRKLKDFAGQHHIKIIGDLPIYVSDDSVDAWSHPEQFQLDENLIPTEVAGCPPDGFSADGQLWGNPLFDWESMKEDGYSWWIARIAHLMKIYDVLRIDHFRGFDSYYAIPYGDNTAARGKWKPGPGIDFFHAVKEKLGDLPIIAEDLGFLTDSVYELLKETGFPGMKVLEFAFDSRDTGRGYKPHQYDHNCVVYAGTHDNETILGWFDTALYEDAKNTIRYFRLNKEEGYNWGLMRSGWSSVADTAIMQMQDFLGLGHEGRMNTPSTLGNNWVWRCRKEDINDALAEKIRKEMILYDRLAKTI